jgi:spore coat protein U-like protein
MKQHYGWLILTGALMAPSAARADVTCTVTVTGVVFGNYNPITTTPNASSGNIGVTCTPTSAGSVSYTIGISAGSSNTFTQRLMMDGPQLLKYNLFLDSAQQQIWGDGTGGTTMMSDGYPIGATQVIKNYAVHGALPIQQNKPAGSYVDSVTVTVTY